MVLYWNGIYELSNTEDKREIDLLFLVIGLGCYIDSGAIKWDQDFRWHNKLRDVRGDKNEFNIGAAQFLVAFPIVCLQ